MIFSGKSMQTFADETIYPFLNKLLESDNEAEVREALNNIKVLIDSGAEGKPFLELQKTLYHNNGKIAHNSLDILRKTSPSARKKVEVRNDVWKAMYPFFCDRASGTPSLALDSLKIIEGLIDYNIVDDYRGLQKVLRHENDGVAHLALDILRKKLTHDEEEKPLNLEPIEKPPQQKEEGSENRIRDINRIRDVLLKNPRYVEILEEAKSKYKTE